MHNYEDDDIDGSEEREAMGMVLANLGDSVKAMRRKRLQKPMASVKVVEVGKGGDGAALSEVDPVATGDGELTEDELAKLEAL